MNREHLIACVIKVLILLSLVAFAIETLPDLDPEIYLWLERFETFCILIFTVEYVLRIYFAKRKWSYVFSFYGLIDLAAILPFWIASGLDLRSLRAFQFLRVFGMFKLARYSAAMQRFVVAFRTIREELLLFGFAALIQLYIAAVGIYYFENAAQPEVFRSIFDALWWATATLTTVGYGDVYPITAGGKVFTFFILVIGLGIVAVPTGLLASALANARRDDNTLFLEQGRQSGPTERLSVED